MTGPHPAVARARTAVRDALGTVEPGGLALVACSGGPDSLALAAATAFVAPRAGRRAGAVVVDHGLQPGSAEVARRTAAACAGLGLDPVEVVTVEVDGARRGGPEARARDARHRALEAAARRHGAVAVLLGHTLDDQAEQVLLGLARGSGTRSLAGMPPRRGPFLRPLLGLRRADTLAVCVALGLEPWHDPTNTPSDTAPADVAPSGTDPAAPAGAQAVDTGGADTAPLRAHVRHRVLPLLEEVLGPGVAQALARTADHLRADDAALDALAADLLARARAGAPDDVVELAVDVLAAAPEALRLRALHRACRAAGVPGADLSRTHVLALDALVVRWRGQGAVHLPGGRRGARTCGRLTLHECPADAGDTAGSTDDHDGER